MDNLNWSTLNVNEAARRASGGLLQRILRLDGLLVGLLLLNAALGLLVLYSAFGGQIEPIQSHLLRLGVGFVLMMLIAQIPPWRLAPMAPWLFGIGAVMLVAVLLIGELGGGARRWLDLGVVGFQPAELIKVALPMMLAWFLAQRPLPASFNQTLLALGIIVLPVAMIGVQPDLGTAILVGTAGMAVLFLAGVAWRLIVTLGTLALAAVPVLWIFGMQDYQRNRVLTFLDPERDPLGAGYNIIQAQIAIGSGGVFGKGWMNGTQAHLDFIPEQHTDFVFAVLAEELGLLGVIILLSLYGMIIARSLWIAREAQDNFSRLLAGALALTFFIYCSINMGMVAGLLPVVGLPLPLVSYGGSSMVTLLAGFGILMSIHSHRRMWSA
ncbi:rod shape-determining protein RodA [Spiribacter salinus]|uniref:rod shape-determining protein RodA n=1 Tax=Spiribacter salinus TaxID=1335746 RepID=UPI001C975E6B|nr:rod shape-determining protein RodA [Spiribacter salinus]